MNKINYYMLFGVKPNASQSIIKKKYRARVKQFHPDMRTGDEEHFKLINEAYAVLMDSHSRALYNIQLFSGSLSYIDVQKIKCKRCKGVGSWMEKVNYGRYKVDSKIVCTICKGTGIIINENKPENK